MNTTSKSVRPNPEGRRVLAPPVALLDQIAHIRVVGNEPFQMVTVRAAIQPKGRHWWESHATFQADARGTIDPSFQKPQSGTYEKLDPMGLFWSMSLKSTDEMASIAAIGAPLPKGTVRLVAEVDSQVIAWTDVVRKGIAPDVTVTRVRDNGLAGFFFRPPGQSPYPVALVISGSSGGIGSAAKFGALLASHGIAVLALAYFRYEHLPKELVNIPLEYFEKAIKWVVSRGDIQPGMLGVLGGSRGGELALILGATFPEIRCVVAYVPSDRVNPGFGAKPWQMVSPRDTTFWVNGLISGEASETWTQVPAWLFRGKRLPYTSIPVERINGPVLLISGKDDMVWPSARMCNKVMRRLQDCKHPHSFKHLSYDHAGHFISVPYVPTGITHLEHPVAGLIVHLGGTAAGNAFANEDSWQQVLRFLGGRL